MFEIGGLRPFAQGDEPALLDLLNAAARPGVAVSRAALASSLSAPGFDPSRDMRVMVNEVGAIAGYRDLRITGHGDEPELLLESSGTLDERSGPLVEWAIGRGREMLAEAGRSAGLIQTRPAEGNLAARDLLERYGFQPVRRLVSMDLPLPADIPEPSFPETVMVTHYRPGQDEAEWVDAFNDAFSSHWGGWMRMPPSRWQHILAEPIFDPALSLVARDGDVIAGFCHLRVDPECRTRDGSTSGYVRYVGTRQAWRGLGLGKALTLAGMGLLRDIGVGVIELGVDADNPTGARHLYEALGFMTTGVQVLHRLDIRASEP